jgi:K+/H+ antiporter YhaU regulatory subunit KhtT
MRKNYGVTVVAIGREKHIIQSPDAHTRLLADDIIVFLGGAENLTEISLLFQPDKRKKFILS